MVERSKAGVVRIIVPVGAIQTGQADDIVNRVLPEFMLMFLAKNRKYAKVGNALGSRGVFPDVHRKVMILKDRIWDGSDIHGEPTREVAMDLLGHLLLMIHMMDTEGTPAKVAYTEGRDHKLAEVGERMADKHADPYADARATGLAAAQQARRDIDSNLDSSIGHTSRGRDDGPNYALAEDDEPMPGFIHTGALLANVGASVKKAMERQAQEAKDAAIGKDHGLIKRVVKDTPQASDSEARTDDHYPGRGGW